MGSFQERMAVDAALLTSTGHFEEPLVFNNSGSSVPVSALVEETIGLTEGGPEGPFNPGLARTATILVAQNNLASVEAGNSFTDAARGVTWRVEQLALEDGMWRLLVTADRRRTR